MAGAAVTEYLSAQDYDRFTAIVRRYSHDVISRAANLSIASEICGKLLRMRPEQYLVIPLAAEEAAQPFDSLLALSLDFPKTMRQFVWGDDPDDRAACEDETRQKWHPYDAAVWDTFIFEYIRLATKQLLVIEGWIEQVEGWAQSDDLTPPDQSATLHHTISQLRETLEAVWAMLTPEAADDRITPVIETAAK